ncbi:MAG: outer membrane lipoprotein-sorting protein [Pseudomonadota bacterium]
MWRYRLAFLSLLWTDISYAQDEAKQIIKRAMDNNRGKSSYSIAEMIVHRPDWERKSSIKVWTEGTEKSLVRVIAPAKDAGNGSLLLGDEMWQFNPKVNRVVKLPASMAHQNWMGSDFTNNDMARADDLIDKYNHKLIAQEKHEGKTVYVIESIPHDDAPVVWGKEVIKVRADHVFLQQDFYDQQGNLVKSGVAQDLKIIEGRTIAMVFRMQKKDVPDEWTEFRMKEAKFDIAIPANYFTLANLRNARD